ncbi:MAG TPA: hypothetical protein VET48_04835 [Steroidobacteraceae bacterium]|nr:hypothetical protein [Steroidobacteraceae bacterium]
MTRGLRLNNPGNIFFNEANNWEGEIRPSTDPELAQFATMPYGIRAWRHVIDSYALRGITTLGPTDTSPGIIPTYSKTDIAAYIANVSHDLGVAPTDALAVDDPTTKFALARAMFKQEQGAIPAATISDDVILQGLSLV